MNVKLKLNTAAALSMSGQIRYHRERADYYSNKFNALPAAAERRRDLAQRLCEAHATRMVELQTGIPVTV